MSKIEKPHVERTGLNHQLRAKFGATIGKEERTCLDSGRNRYQNWILYLSNPRLLFPV